MIDEKALIEAAKFVTNSNYMTEEIQLRKAKEIIEAYEAAKTDQQFDTTEVEDA